MTALRIRPGTSDSRPLVHDRHLLIRDYNSIPTVSRDSVFDLSLAVPRLRAIYQNLGHLIFPDCFYLPSSCSPGFLRFVSILEKMSGPERKHFLQFATGCSSLPPGGLANLYPRLTVVKKVDAGDGSFPSVNTCVHYLKLPDYSSEDIMRDRLLAATQEKGFHLN